MPATATSEAAPYFLVGAVLSGEMAAVQAEYGETSRRYHTVHGVFFLSSERRKRCGEDLLVRVFAEWLEHLRG